MSETTFSLLSPVQKQQIAAAVSRYQQQRTILRDPYKDLRATIGNLSYAYVESISDKDVKFGLTNRDIPIVYQIGLRYITSQSTNPKLSSANGMVLFLEAADENYGPAEFTLGCELLFGRFKHPYLVPEHGIHYLQRAIAHKVPEAAYLMGMINLLGYRNTLPNYTDASKYFQIGAKLGSSDSAFHLAQLWYEKNLELGRYEFDWYRYIEQAARGGNQLAQLVMCERQVAEMLNGKLELHALFKILGHLDLEFESHAGEILEDLVNIFQLTQAQVAEIQEGTHYLEAREITQLLAENAGLAQELYQLNQLWARDHRLTEAMYRKVRSQYRHATQVIARNGLENSGYEESIQHVLPLFYVAHHNFLKERPQEIPERATREFEEFLDRYNNKRRQDHDEYQRKHKLIRNYPAQRATRRTNTFGKISKNALKAQLKNNSQAQQPTTQVGPSLYKRRLGLVSQQARMWTQGMRKGMCSTIQTLGSIQQMHAPKPVAEADPLQEALEKKRNYQGVYRLLGMYGVQYYMQHRDVYYRKTQIPDRSNFTGLPLLTQRAIECQGLSPDYGQDTAPLSTFPGLRNIREYNNWALESVHLTRDAWEHNGRLVADSQRDGYVVDSWAVPATQRLGQLVSQALAEHPEDVATAWKDFKFLYNTLLVRHLDYAAELRQRMSNYREREQAQLKPSPVQAPNPAQLSTPSQADTGAVAPNLATTPAQESDLAAASEASSVTGGTPPRKGRKGNAATANAEASEGTAPAQGTGKKITKALFGSAISSVVTVFKKPPRSKAAALVHAATASSNETLLPGEFGLDYADTYEELTPLTAVPVAELEQRNLAATLSVISLDNARELASQTTAIGSEPDSAQAMSPTPAHAATAEVTEASVAEQTEVAGAVSGATAHAQAEQTVGQAQAQPVLIPLPVPPARSPYPKLTSNAVERVINSNEAFYLEALESELTRFSGLKLPSASEVHASALAQAQQLRQQRLEQEHIFTDLSGIYEANDFQFAYEDDFSTSDDDELEVAMLHEEHLEDETDLESSSVESLEASAEAGSIMTNQAPANFSSSNLETMPSHADAETSSTNTASVPRATPVPPPTPTVESSAAAHSSNQA